jgi:hypothetical protein
MRAPRCRGRQRAIPWRRRGSNSVSGSCSTTANTNDLEAITRSECRGVVRAARCRQLTHGQFQPSRCRRRRLVNSVDLRALRGCNDRRNSTDAEPFAPDRAAPARPCEPLAQHRKAMAQSRIGPGMPVGAGGADRGPVRGAFAAAFQHAGHEDSTKDHGETCCRDGRHGMEPATARGGHGQTSAPPRIQDSEGQLCNADGACPTVSLNASRHYAFTSGHLLSESGCAATSAGIRRRIL